MKLSLLLWISAWQSLTCAVVMGAAAHEQQHQPPTFPENRDSGGSNNNYAVIVSTSRYWFNYRHQTNALSLYQLLKQYGGYDDEHIVLMIADDGSVAANPRNPVKNRVYNTAAAASTSSNHILSSASSVYTNETQIDFRGDDVTVENFLHVLTGHDNLELHSTTAALSRNENAPQPRVSPHRSRPKERQLWLNSNRQSNVLIYLTGHGGDSFLKFRDETELTARQLAAAIATMHAMGRYQRVLVMADTCQAFTLGNYLAHIPNVTMIGSALLGESSYAHSSNAVLGLAVVEKYTHYMLQHVQQQWLVSTQQQQQRSANKVAAKATRHAWDHVTIYQALVQPYSKQLLASTVGILDSEDATIASSSSLRGSNLTLASFFAAHGRMESPSSSSSSTQRVVPQLRLLTSHERVRWTVPQDASRSSSTNQTTLAPRGTNQTNKNSDTCAAATTPAWTNSAFTTTTSNSPSCHSPVRPPATTMTMPIYEPHDPVFVALVVGLLAFVVVSNRLWS
jgi:GPI-anchor transamidase subunit K